MILSLLACFIGIIIGVMAFIHYSSFDGFDKTFAAGILFFISCFFVLLAMAVYTGVTVNYYGKALWQLAVLLVLHYGLGGGGAHFLLRYLLHVCLQDARVPEKLQLPLTCRRRQRRHRRSQKIDGQDPTIQL
ncbi:hypothetical protein fugu_011099 [Takifugu bimaculatus]|uniref:Uncharacterized protein n=1 Tax=Takifugu bimaculatus TaxID=433685 RepID=A0A4Z2CBV8_9TELE|nr:hypothetical protein fugu_011099 [Takifugu bimaculatus]